MHSGWVVAAFDETGAVVRLSLQWEISFGATEKAAWMIDAQRLM
jgi:hypothetical protein